MRALVTAACLGLVASAAAAAEPAGKAAWRTEYAQARAAAREAGKPILVVLRCEA